VDPFGVRKNGYIVIYNAGLLFIGCGGDSCFSLCLICAVWYCFGAKNGYEGLLSLDVVGLVLWLDVVLPF